MRVSDLGVQSSAPKIRVITGVVCHQNTSYYKLVPRKKIYVSIKLQNNWNIITISRVCLKKVSFTKVSFQITSGVVRYLPSGLMCAVLPRAKSVVCAHADKKCFNYRVSAMQLDI